MDRNGRMILRLVVGGYVIYLAVDLIIDQLSGRGTLSNTVAFIAPAVLLLGGAVVCFLSVKEYLSERKKDAQRKEAQETTRENTEDE